MNIRLCFFLVIICIVSGCRAHASGARPGGMQRHVIYLASDSLYGRLPGTIGERRAADYIAGYLSRSCGAVVSQQRFPFSIDSLHAADTATNIIGIIDRHYAQTVVICAHYDHLGSGAYRSRDFQQRHMIHPGADDNASGVGLMLELARWVHSTPSLHFNFIFLATSAHEAGLYGARYFVASHFADRYHISSVLNFDMLGRMSTTVSALKVSSSDTATAWQAEMERTGGDKQFAFHFDNEVQNDFTVFRDSGYHAFSFTTGIHDDYHRHTDTADKINYKGMDTIFLFLKMWIKGQSSIGGR